MNTDVVVVGRDLRCGFEYAPVLGTDSVYAASFVGPLQSSLGQEMFLCRSMGACEANICSRRAELLLDVPLPPVDHLSPLWSTVKA